MKEKRYLILLDTDARKRHHHVSEHGNILEFMVQLEIKCGAVWKEVLRYDCAHGYAHKDAYNISRKCRKIRLSLHHEEALTLADDDINENWALYRDRFLRGGFP